MHEQTRRVLEVLRISVRLRGISHREIEHRMGWSRNYLGRLFSGEIQLKFDHLPPLLEILELDPGEFFQIAFPPQPWKRPGPLSPFLPPYDPGPAPAPIGPHLTEAELRALVRKVMDQFADPEPADPESSE